MKIGFWGAGKMAQGIRAAIKKPHTVVMSSVEANRNVEIAKTCGLIFLAVRPGDVEAVAKEVKPYLKRGQTIVSICAGRKLEYLRREFGTKVRIIRVMPNLALRVGAGMCALTSHDKLVEAILGGAGEVTVLSEKAFDAVTALSGSGPAYFAYMAQAMMEGGIKLGLAPKVARLLSEQTMYGTAKFLRESGMDLKEFIAGVCTKGGTTAAGMKHLDRPQFKRSVTATLEAAAKRSKELA